MTPRMIGRTFPDDFKRPIYGEATATGPVELTINGQTFGRGGKGAGGGCKMNPITYILAENHCDLGRVLFDWAQSKGAAGFGLCETPLLLAHARRCPIVLLAYEPPPEDLAPHVTSLVSTATIKGAILKEEP